MYVISLRWWTTLLKEKQCLIYSPSDALFNPLSTNSDQHQISPNNIHTLSRDKVMRISKVITKDKMP